jgi:hypothetical protein
VSEDGNAYAVYYACFGVTHPSRIVRVLISVGEWGDDAGPWDRVAFPLEIRVNGDRFGVGLVDAADSPWKDVQIMGRLLDRSEALEHERVKDVFHITDHIVTDDALLRDYLEGPSR